MENLLTLLKDFSWVSVIVRILLATIMGGLIGGERGRHGRAAGLRTHILVCVGSALTSLTGLHIASMPQFGGDVFRISAQVVSGIGFLGAGMILIRHKSIVTGLTTAAGMWATACIGIAVGYGFYSGSIIATIICIFSVTVLGHLENKTKNIIRFYAEITNISETSATVESIKSVFPSKAIVEIISARSSTDGNIGLLIYSNSVYEAHSYIEELNELENVVFAIEDNG